MIPAKKGNKMPQQSEIPRIGVGVIILQQTKILLGQRIGAHGAHTWSFPGGHLEFNESWEDCAIREVREETGLDITDVHFAAVTNDRFLNENRHYVTIFMITNQCHGQVAVMEPDKCLGWDWFSWDALPEPLFLPIQHLIAQGYNPISYQNQK